MGRGQQSEAQATLTDQFAAIMGTRRGLRPEQVKHSSVPGVRGRRRTPFARNKIDAARRMALLSWWLHGMNALRDSPVQARVLSQECGVYEEMGRQGSMSTRDSVLRGDLKALVKQGVLGTHHKAGRAYYGVLAPEKWPEEHQEAWAKASAQPSA